MKRHTIVIATESDIIRFGLTSIISGFKEMSPMIMESNIDDIENSLDKQSPAILIVDAEAMSADTLEAIITQKPPTTHIIGLTHSLLPNSTIRLFDSTISIYDSTDTIQEHLLRAISIKDDTNIRCSLTSREKEIVIGIVKGQSNKEIASSINVSVNTVMTHRRNIASKLQIHSPAGLTIYAIVSKLVTIDEVKSSIV